MMNLSAAGSPTWQHSPYASGNSFTHMSVRTDLNYGYRYETEVTSLPGRSPKTGTSASSWSASGGVLTSRIRASWWPRSSTSHCSTTGLPAAAPGPSHSRVTCLSASRTHVAGSREDEMVVPSDLHFGFAPAAMILELKFDGFNQLNIVRDLVPFPECDRRCRDEQLRCISFAVRADDPELRGAIQCDGTSARPPSSQRLRQQIRVQHRHRALDGRRLDPHDAGRERDRQRTRLAFGRAVRAVADGKVVACRRTAPDNPFNVIQSKDANFVTIQHTVDPFDQTRTERISYLHFQQDSVPLRVCPNVCPEDAPACDLATEGVDPNGAELPTPVDVIAGQFIGRVGNSGNSSSPHLHVHMTTGESATGSYPLLFHEVVLQSADEDPDGPMWPVDNAAILHGSLAFPTD